MGWPAEHYARLYMRQPWGGKAAMPYRHLLAVIRAELEDPMRRCPACEEPGYPALLEWPERSQMWTPYLHKRYLLCVSCGHTITVYHSLKKPGMRRVTLPEEEICRLYQQGIGTPEIATKFYCSKGTVLRILHEHGVTVRPRGGSQPRQLSLAELNRYHYLYQVKGLEQSKIAQVLGVSESTVYTRLKRMREEGWFPDRKYRRKGAPSGNANGHQVRQTTAGDTPARRRSSKRGAREAVERQR